jgi:DNA-binding transcriptional ArsR family regulator
MTDTKAVLRKLLTDHVGQDNAITQSQLSEATGVTPSTLRSELRRLRQERNIPIANQRDGYYVIATDDELSDYVGHINSEIQSKRQTIEHTLEAFEAFDPEDAVVTPGDDGQQEPQEPTYSCSVEGCDRDFPKSDARWPKQGKYEDQVVCKRHLGELIQRGEA